MQRLEPGEVVHADAVRTAAGEHAGAGRGAVRTGGIAVGQFHSLGGELVEMRRLDYRGAETAEIAVTHVIGEQEHDVGSIVWFGRVC